MFVVIILHLLFVCLLTQTNNFILNLESSLFENLLIMFFVDFMILSVMADVSYILIKFNIY